MKTRSITTTPVILTAGKDLSGYRSIYRSFAPLRMTGVLLLLFLLAACTSAPEAGEPGFDAAQGTVNIIIPEYPHSPLAKGEYPEGGRGSTRVAWDTPGAPGRWEEGDKLYINVRYGDALGRPIPSLDYFTCIALRSGGKWIFEKPVPLPAEAERLFIGARYTVTYPGCDADVNSLVLDNGSNANASPTITLNPFYHTSTRITFTNLSPGDEVSFKESDGSAGWCLRSLKRQNAWFSDQFQSIPPLKAGADGTVTVYVDISPTDPDCCYRINGQPSGDGQWRHFHPGAVPEGGYNYCGLSYTVDGGGE